MTGNDFFAIAGLLTAFVGVPSGIMIVMLKGLRTDNVETSKELAEFRSETRKELNALNNRIDDVERGKVSHADWVRVATSQLNRMNRISEQVAELGGKLDGNSAMTMNLGSGINRIAAAVEKHGG